MKINICMCAKCTMRGAGSIYDAVEYIENMFLDNDDYKELAQDEKVSLEIYNRLDSCKKLSNISVSPVVEIDGDTIYMATAHEVSEKILNRLKGVIK